MENKNVYITLIRIYTPKGGDFYIALKSSLIKNKEDIIQLNLSSLSSKEEVLEAAKKIDSDAKIVGGIILCRNEEVQIGGVYRPSMGNEVEVDSLMMFFEEKIESFHLYLHGFSGGLFGRFGHNKRGIFSLYFIIKSPFKKNNPTYKETKIWNGK